MAGNMPEPAMRRVGEAGAEVLRELPSGALSGSVRFIVSEIDGYPIMARSWQYDHAPMLSVSVLDRWEALRRRAHGLAASLEAQHA